MLITKPICKNYGLPRIQLWAADGQALLNTIILACILMTQSKPI